MQIHMYIHLSAISGWNCKLENRTTRKTNGARSRTDDKHGSEGRVTKLWETLWRRLHGRSPAAVREMSPRSSPF